MRFTPLITLFCVVITGCATGHVTHVTDETIRHEKVISLAAPTAPWIIEIEKRLASRGFEVLRWSTTTEVTQKTAPTRVEQFSEAESRYVLVVNGSAQLNWAQRCFGGGYKFDRLSVDLVDARENQTILNVNGSGYSEDCPPLSGTIFTDIARAVDDAWAD